jgi:hypothetical protein
MFMPIEIEAYLNQDNWDYCMQEENTQWKEFEELTLKEKRELAKEYYEPHLKTYITRFLREKLMRTSN